MAQRSCDDLLVVINDPDSTAGEIAAAQAEYDAKCGAATDGGFDDEGDSGNNGPPPPTP